MKTLDCEQLAFAICAAMEPRVPVITAREAREATKGFRWCSCYHYPSPGGWWVAEIGTDHGPVEMDDDLVTWKPVPGLLEDISVAWRVIDEMKMRGWLFHIMQMTDGWVVTGSRYHLNNGSWSEAMMTTDVAQETGEDVTEAICRAAIDALSGVKK